ncbi:MAG: ankyrin repeat domain-containing protein [Planctomycetaceae bacterium]
MIQIDLRKLAIQNRVEELRTAIMEEADPNMKDRLGSTALLAAIAYKRLEVIPVLLEHGADVTAQDKDGSTALHYAIEHKLPAVLEALVERCPEAVFISDKHGNQPLWTAAFNARGEYEMVSTLLRNGANPNHCNNIGLCPLDTPKRKGELALLHLLESAPSAKT